MGLRKIKTSTGDVLEVNIIGNSLPDAETVQDVYNGGKKDIRIKSIKKIESANDLSTFDAIKNNVGRGASFGATRYGEKNKEATDRWNDKHPFLSTVADLAGGLPLAIIPGVGFAKTAQTLAKIPKLLKVAKNMNKVSKFVKGHKAISAGIGSGIWSGTRANIESRDWDPENVASNTVRSAMLGVPLGMVMSAGGSGITKLMNRKQVKAQNLIDKLGGQKNFKKVADESKKLIESADPAISDLLKSTKLTAKDKAIIVAKYRKAQDKAPAFVEKALKDLSPQGKSQNFTVNLMKKLSDLRYGKVDFGKEFDVNTSKTVMKVAPGSVKAKPQIVPDDRHFAAAAKKAAQRSPASGLGDDWMSNKLNTNQLVAVRREMYDMQQQYLAKNRKLDAAEIGQKIKEINQYIAEKNPNLQKADKSFARMKGVEKGYEEGKNFKGYAPGETEHAPNASFVRGIWEQAKANRANIGGVNSLGDFDKVLPQHLQNFLSTTRPKAFGRVKSGLERLGREKSNLETMISTTPEYKKGLNTHGPEIFKAITMPRNAAGRQIAKAAGNLSSQYEYNPKEMADMMYRNSQKVYKNVVKRAKPTKSGKVLDTVLQSFAKTGGRSLLNGRRFNGL
jgi:hypothetical protein